MNNKWKNVNKHHILQAIKLFDEDPGEYPSARNTFLLIDNKEYPAKHIRGIAYKIANEEEISKNDYSGGEETVNFLKKLGFTIKYGNKIIE